MTNKYLEFGIDFAQDEYGEPIIAENGDLLSTVSGLETLHDDIKNTVYMQKGENNRRPGDGVNWEAYENKNMTDMSKELLRLEMQKMVVSDVRVTRAEIEFDQTAIEKLEYNIIFNPVGTDEIINISEGRNI